MVGLVIVAHSVQLAESVQELAGQMVHERVPLAIAGGIDDPAHPFGTDVMRIRQAIESVYSTDGVVVLMDLGSALLSAEMALEFLHEDQRAGVCLCEAPLVEGAIAAAVRAEAGGDLEQVIAEARGALAAKAAQLQMDTPDVSLAASVKPTVPVKTVHLVVHNRLGLHTRPAAQLVTRASQFQSEITMRNASRNTEAISAKSINLVMALGVRQGHEIMIAATGFDADEALDALEALVENQFGETEKTLITLPEYQTPDAPQPNEDELTGIPASPGIAIGPVVLYRPSSPKVREQHGDAPQVEWQRLQRALQTARQEIQDLSTRTVVQTSADEAAIFDAHLLFLEDPFLVDGARQRIFDDRLNTEAAWQAVADEMIARYHILEIPDFRARAADLADVRDRVLRLLTGTVPTSLELSQPAILIAVDLAPSDIVHLDSDKVLGIGTALGGVTSHSAILARARGIPAVVGLGPVILRVAEGTLVALDGQKGRAWLAPDNVAVLEEQRAAWLSFQHAAQVVSQRPAVTTDGQRIEVTANIRGTADVQIALDSGAEGVGLLRTEFLYLNRSVAPSEEEQLVAYKAIAEVLGTRPLIIRTLDVGGDKQLPYLGLPVETNPFLGRRGIRLCLDRSDLLKTQLRAILRAAPGHHVKIMFPMVSSTEEVCAAKGMLGEVQTELRQSGILFDESIEVGIMIEVPSAVAVADQLVVEADFFSIGTNDLSQYTMAADRTNVQVAPLADAFHPAVLRMIRQTVQVAHAAGIWVGLCGELASDPLATPILLGLRLDELSLNPPAIPYVKQMITKLTMPEAETIAKAVLNLDSADSVRHYVAERVSSFEINTDLRHFTL